MTTDTITKPSTKIQLEPVKMWKVIFLNDDYTPVDFVEVILMRFYNKSADDASAIAMMIHESGRGVAGIYTREIAEQKAHDTVAVARENGFPLMAIAESA